MATLVILRHAKAEPSSGASASASAGASGGTDKQRRLAARGWEQARTAAGHLVERGLVPDIVLCSAAVRTRETWEGIAAEFPGAPGPSQQWAPPGGVHVLEELYSARPETVYDLVRQHAAAHAGEIPPEATMLVVGHEPIMSMTASQYADATSDQAAMFSVQAGMSTASMAVLDLPAWDARAGRLRALLRA